MLPAVCSIADMVILMLLGPRDGGRRDGQAGQTCSAIICAPDEGDQCMLYVSFTLRGSVERRRGRGNGKARLLVLNFRRRG